MLNERAAARHGAMIFVVERPAGDSVPRAWFAYDFDDLLRKIECRDPAGAAVVAGRGAASTANPSPAPPAAAGDAGAPGCCRIFWNEAEATAAFEREDDEFWQGAGWRARRALRDQLVALEVLADDL